jgi:hypothetical protein
MNIPSLKGIKLKGFGLSLPENSSALNRFEYTEEGKCHFYCLYLLLFLNMHAVNRVNEFSQNFIRHRNEKIHT